MTPIPPNVREQAEALQQCLGCGAPLVCSCGCGHDPAQARAIESALLPLYRIADMLKCDVSIVEEALEYALLAAEERGRRAGFEAAAKQMDAQAASIIQCANTYERNEPGRPRETLYQEAAHYSDAAKICRALLPQPETQDK